MQNVAGPGIEPMFPALAGGLLTTGPPGQSLAPFLTYQIRTAPSPPWQAFFFFFFSIRNLMAGLLRGPNRGLESPVLDK